MDFKGYKLIAMINQGLFDALHALLPAGRAGAGRGPLRALGAAPAPSARASPR